MDAYDIFKWVSKGLKFPKTSTNLNKAPSSNIQTHSIKQTKKDSSETDSKFESIQLNDNKQEIKQGKKRKQLDENELKRKKVLLEKEEVNHYRNVNNISVIGRRIPNPLRSFEEFNVGKDIIENLKKCGYEEPTAIQKQAVPIMLERRQLLACAPTGSGKTAAFLVPLIQHLKGPEKQGFRALILCPTRELAKQIQRECLKLSEGRGFRVHIISKIKKALTQYGPKSNRKFDILITPPKRLCFLLKQDPPAIQLSNIEWLIIDEADKLFEEGNRSFRDQLDQILAACTSSDRKITMFSATHTPVVAKWAVHNMPQLIRVTVGQRNTATDTVLQELLFTGCEYGKLVAFRNLVKQGLEAPVLIFVQSKERADQLFRELIYDGIMVDSIHADKTQAQRDNTVRSFREGRIWVLICTELMARGIDFRVNLVINYDFPPSMISYVHRVGRAGRAGRIGKAITFWTLEDKDNLRSMAQTLKESGCDVPESIFSIKKKPKKEIKKMGKKAPNRKDIATDRRNKKGYKKFVGTTRREHDKESNKNPVDDKKTKVNKKKQNDFDPKKATKIRKNQAVLKVGLKKKDLNRKKTVKFKNTVEQ